MATKKNEGVLFTLPKLERARIHIPIVGTSDLWPNPFTPWAIQDMVENQTVGEDGDKAKVKAGKKDKPLRDPEQERPYYLHLLEPKTSALEKKLREKWTKAQLEAHLGFPCTGFKSAMQETAKALPGVTGKDVARLMYVGYDEGSPVDNHLVKIDGKIRPRFAMTMIGGMNKVPYPVWSYAVESGWKATLQVTFFKDLANWEDIVRLVDYSGQLVGIGSNRPSGKKSSGECGTWMLADANKCKLEDVERAA